VNGGSNEEEEKDLVDTSNVYLSAFDVKAWIGTAICLAVLSLGLAVVTVSPPEGWPSIASFLPVAAERSFYILLQRDSDQPSSTTSQRVALLTAQIFGFLLLAHYSSIFTAILTIAPPEAAPTSWKVRTNSFSRSDDNLRRDKELSDDEFRVLIPEGGLQEEIVKSAKEGSETAAVFAKLAEFIPDGGEDEVAKRLAKDDKLLVFDSHFKSSYADLEAFRAFSGAVRNGMGLAFPRGSELRQLFAYHLGKMRQSGVLDRIRQTWLGRGKPKALPERRIFGEVSSPLGWTRVYFPFWLTAACAVLASASVVVELCCNKRRKGRRTVRPESNYNFLRK